jgi:hypothetical protein
MQLKTSIWIVYADVYEENGPKRKFCLMFIRDLSSHGSVDKYPQGY